MRASSLGVPFLALGLFIARTSHAQGSAPTPPAPSTSTPALPPPPPPPDAQTPPASAPPEETPLGPPPAPPPAPTSSEGAPPAPTAEAPPPPPKPAFAPPPPRASPGPSIWGSGVGPQNPKGVQRWYGWQTIIATVPGDLLTIFLPQVGIPVHLLAGPIVHWGHGHAARGFAALGINVGLPIGMYATSLAVRLATVPKSELITYVMLAAGYIGGPLIDILALSTETVPAPASQAKGRTQVWPSSVSLLPILDPTRKGLMLVGQF